MFESICSGALNYLGPVNNLNLGILKKILTPNKIKKLDNKKDFINRINYIDGKGLFRVKNIILKCLNGFQKWSSICLYLKRE